MISNVSFGSTFKVNNKENNFQKFQQFGEYASEIENNPNVTVQFEDKFNIKDPYFGTFDYKAGYTVIAPDEKDIDIETYCQNNGIKFHRYNTEDLTSPEGILKRIKPAPKGYIRAMVDVDKLSELLKNQNSNFQHCEKDYQNYYKEQTDIMLKNGNPISAPTLYINSYNSKEEMLEYINKFGSDNLNENSLFIDLAQTTSDPEHCLYFAMKDLGFEQIPVYVNKDSYEMGQALGIIK